MLKCSPFCSHLKAALVSANETVSLDFRGKFSLSGYRPLGNIAYKPVLLFLEIRQMSF